MVRTRKDLILNQMNSFTRNCSLSPDFERIYSWRQILHFPTSDLFVTCTEILVTRALQLQNITWSLHDYKIINNSCSLRTVTWSCQLRLHTKCSPSSVPLVAFWHCSQAVIWSGRCFVAHKAALGGTSPTRAGTALLPGGQRRGCCLNSEFQSTTARFTNSVEVLPPARKAPQPVCQRPKRITAQTLSQNKSIHRGWDNPSSRR